MYENIDLPFINGINCTDWDASVTAEKRVETLLAKAKDGDIVLLHDFAGNNNTVDALGEIIDGLLEKDFAKRIQIQNMPQQRALRVNWQMRKTDDASRINAFVADVMESAIDFGVTIF